MKTFSRVLMIILSAPLFCLGQDVNEVISKVKATQLSTKQISYELARRDTIGTYIRQMRGNVIMEQFVRDTIFGFKFWGKKDNEQTEKMYDGYNGYDIDNGKKTYELTRTAFGFKNLLNGGGGHLVLPDLMRLDTSGNNGITLKQDADNYYMMIKYPDLVKYDVIHKYKAIKISRKTMLPVSVRVHQETLGRIQDLYYEVIALKTNENALTYNFLSPDFLKTYKHIVPVDAVSPVLSFIGKPLPEFKLQTFNGEWISGSNFKGKPVLLDLWEVWCAPCIESMPKVEELFKKYKEKGLLVYGITNEKENLSSAKMLVANKRYTMPMLIGNKELKNKLKITGVPVYMLLDKAGKVVFISEGYSERLEEEIRKVL